MVLLCGQCDAVLVRSVSQGPPGERRPQVPWVRQFQRDRILNVVCARAVVEAMTPKEMTKHEEPTDGLILAMRDRGHDPFISQLNGQTGYIEARCSRCNARGWGWYFVQSGSHREDMDGPGVTAPCAQVR